MHKLIDDLAFWAKAWVPLEIAVRAHHRLAWIHPYENGNGRHARFIGDMILHSLGYPYPIWPTHHESGARKTYLQAMREADKGDFFLLIDYFIQYGA